jgi:hypothetical protein
MNKQEKELVGKRLHQLRKKALIRKSISRVAKMQLHLQKRMPLVRSRHNNSLNSSRLGRREYSSSKMMKETCLI